MYNKIRINAEYIAKYGLWYSRLSSSLNIMYYVTTERLVSEKRTGIE